MFTCYFLSSLVKFKALPFYTAYPLFLTTSCRIVCSSLHLALINQQAVKALFHILAAIVRRPLKQIKFFSDMRGSTPGTCPLPVLIVISLHPERVVWKGIVSELIKWLIMTSKQMLNHCMLESWVELWAWICLLQNQMLIRKRNSFYCMYSALMSLDFCALEQAAF